MLKIHDLLTGWCWYYNWNLNCVRNRHWNWDIMYIMMGRFWFWLRHWLWGRLRLWWRRRARCGLWFRFWVWVIVVVSIAISRPFSPSMSTTLSLVIVGIPTVLAAACSSYVNVATNPWNKNTTIPKSNSVIYFLNLTLFELDLDHYQHLLKERMLLVCCAFTFVFSHPPYSWYLQPSYE